MSILPPPADSVLLLRDVRELEVESERTHHERLPLVGDVAHGLGGCRAPTPPGGARAPAPPRRRPPPTPSPSHSPSCSTSTVPRIVPSSRTSRPSCALAVPPPAA